MTTVLNIANFWINQWPLPCCNVEWSVLSSNYLDPYMIQVICALETWLKSRNRRTLCKTLIHFQHWNGSPQRLPPDYISISEMNWGMASATTFSKSRICSSSSLRHTYSRKGHIPLWRHQMATFSALVALSAGNSPVTGEFPSQRPVTRSFDVFFDLRLNERLSKQSRRR